jgi:hypothetical protein
VSLLRSRCHCTTPALGLLGRNMAELKVRRTIPTKPRKVFPKAPPSHGTVGTERLVVVI